MLKAPNPNKPIQPMDFSDVASAQRHLAEASEELSSMVDDIASARTVKEFSSDRLKRALAIPMREFIVAGDSAAAAETKAKASKSYGEEIESLSEQYEQAQRVIAKWEATQARFDAARSTLSSLKTIAGNL